MLIIAFGLPGAGKTFFSKILKEKYGFYFLEGDNALTDEMKDCITRKASFTQDMMDNFTRLLVNRIRVLKSIFGSGQNIVVSQALFKQKNRLAIREAFPDAIFVHVNAEFEVFLSRLLKRGDDVTADYVAKIMSDFELPGNSEAPTVTINNDEAEETLIENIEKYFALSQKNILCPIPEIDLASKKVLITAGPTREYIDPVRYISNESSGKMGYQIARAFVESGVKVVLVSGPTSLEQPDKLEKFIKVVSAEQMYQAVMAEINDTDIFIGVAAVADYTPMVAEKEKIKKKDEICDLKLKRTTDILAEVANFVAESNRPIFVVGFAAETKNLFEYALNKLTHKNIDIICANQVGENKVFGKDENELVVLKRNNQIIHIPLKSKGGVAEELANLIVKDYVSLSRIRENSGKINSMILHRSRQKRIIQHYLERPLLKDLTMSCNYKDIQIKTIDDNNYFGIRLFKQANSDQVPTILYFPGAGFTRMVHPIEDLIASRLFRESHCNVAIVKYRLAPESEYPAALFDAYSALEYLVEHAVRLGIRSDLLVALGYSSGGTLVIQLAILAQANHYPIAHQVLISPQSDFTFSNNTYSNYEKNDRYVDNEFLRSSYQYYLPSSELSSPMISPYFHTFSAIPMTQIIIGENDVLRSDVEAFSNKLISAGLPINKVVLPKLDHCSFWEDAQTIAILSTTIKTRFNIVDAVDTKTAENTTKKVGTLSEAVTALGKVGTFKVDAPICSTASASADLETLCNRM